MPIQTTTTTKVEGRTTRAPMLILTSMVATSSSLMTMAARELKPHNPMLATAAIPVEINPRRMSQLVQWPQLTLLKLLQHHLREEGAATDKRAMATKITISRLLHRTPNITGPVAPKLRVRPPIPTQQQRTINNSNIPKDRERTMTTMPSSITSKRRLDKQLRSKWQVEKSRPTTNKTSLLSSNSSGLSITRSKQPTSSTTGSKQELPPNRIKIISLRNEQGKWHWHRAL